MNMNTCGVEGKHIIYEQVRLFPSGSTWISLWTQLGCCETSIDFFPCFLKVAWEVKLLSFWLRFLLFRYHIIIIPGGKVVRRKKYLLQRQEGVCYMSLKGVRLDSEQSGMLSFRVWYLCWVNLHLHRLVMDLMQLGCAECCHAEGRT